MVTKQSVSLFVCLLVTICVGTKPFDDLGPFTSTPVLQTPQGSIQGIIGNGFQAYLGIPYASPPIGDLRFAAPVAAPTFTGVFNASLLSHACPQPAWGGVSELQSEDCLYLNVFTPIGVTSTSNLPVMFYIHGGGWTFGSGMDPLYWGNNFATQDTGVILVTINYRLGALGWLTAPAFNTFNYGFLDQQSALLWVQKNIGAYGGDSSRVTISGQSAGGICVTTHVTVPSSFPLFSQAICHSGPPVATFANVTDRFKFGDSFAKHLGCASSNTTCFRSKSVDEILEAQKKVLPLPPLIPLDDYPNAIMAWMPVVDGVVIFDSPQTLIDQGKTAKVPMVWGTVRNETAGYVDEFLPGTPIISAEYSALVSVFFGKQNVSQVEQYYPPSTPKNNRVQLAQMTGDYIFTCSIRASARSYAQSGNPTYKYVFLHPPSSDPRCNGTVSHCASIQSACHGAELDYVFHTATYANASFTAQESTLSYQTLGLWTSFVNGTIQDTLWEPYNPSVDNSLALDIPAPYMLNGWRKEQCDFWDTYGRY